MVRLLHLALVALISGVPAKQSSIKPGEIWNDIDGNEIKAHAAGLLTVGETIYWYGSDNYDNGAFGNTIINVYTSQDLTNWKSHGPAFVFNCSEIPAKKCNGDRVKVLYNSKTDRYVMWMKSMPYVAVASSVSPLGPFKFEGRWSPFGEPHAGDPTAFLDPVSGNGFWIYSSKLNASDEASRVVRVSQMTDDFLNLTQIVSTIQHDNEAPAAFYDSITKQYHVWTSHTTGWNPNSAELFTSKSLAGPWTSGGNPCNSSQANHSKTFYSQSTYILPWTTQTGVQRFIYVGDRWTPYVKHHEYGAPRYVWLPIDVAKDGTVNVNWRDSWTLEDLEVSESIVV